MIVRTVALALFFAGCQSAPEPAPTSRADSPDIGPAQAGPVEGDSLEADSEIGEWVVTATGAGPLLVGATEEEAAASAGPFEEPYDPQGECHYVRPAGAPDGLIAMIFEGTVARIDVSESGAQTAEGLGVGSTAESVRQAYGARVTEEPHVYTDGQYLIIDADADRRIVFETDGDTVTRVRAGRMPEVMWVEGCS